ncbi:unnamed protein product [Dicrocoelium dendriticum]|nr:unnamed protein product [Dicrocoelium dendriticum]
MATIITILLLLVELLKLDNGQQFNDLSYEPDFLDMDPDSILEENAIITANATCGTTRREYYCRLVEHAGSALLYRRNERKKRQVVTYQKQSQSYRDPSGHWVQCSFCDASDPKLSHPIEYVLSGESHLWWQSPSLAEGLKYHAVTITMDFRQVYQIVYVLLRMGDSPRPANWILERSLDGENYKPWAFFAESEYDCRRLYQPLLNGPLTITSGPRPWKLEDDEVYCTTFYSQPQALQSGEIIVTLSLDRASTIAGPSGIERAISSKLIDFLSARFVRLRFQKLQTLSGDWMAMPNQLDSSVYNRYYYSIRTIKVGGKCLCNSHANRCEQRVVEGLPRAVCVCQHNTCGNNCESCCPMFNQQLWRPGRMCEECNCHGKADSCVFNQTVANLRLSQRKDGIYEGGGVCVDCREDTTGINCESCKPGFYRPTNVRPDSPFPCVKCDCETFGSTGECVATDVGIPERYPGDCICKEGFAGKRCDQCAEGYRRSDTDPTSCVPCTCDVRGSHLGGGYKCEPPCNCKVNVNPDSHCRVCQPGHFNLDINNPEGCQACYCSGLTDRCDGVGHITALSLERNGLLGTVSTLSGWKILVPDASLDGAYPVAHHDSAIGEEEFPLFSDVRTVESWLSSASLKPVDRGYYWSSPVDYLGKQIAAYRARLVVILRFNSPTLTRILGSLKDMAERSTSTSLAVRDQLDYMWLNEPDIVIEGNGYRLAYILPVTHRDNHLIIDLTLHESSFRVLVEPPSSVQVDKIPIGLSQGSVGFANRVGDFSRNYQQVGRPATVSDLIAVLSRLDRLLIKAKFISDQTTIELRQVKLERAERDSTGRIPNMEECVCPAGHTGTSCESCAFGYWKDPKRGAVVLAGMWRDTDKAVQPLCVPCECNGHSAHCDEYTGKCISCEHNTAGDKCDKCAPGFYGDAVSGGPEACQPCACPTLTNQKTEVCVAHEQAPTTDLKPYICLDCDENTRGRFCELCAPGYYGEPEKGIECEQCDCGPGAVGCNGTTGACICGFNTAGPRCEECAEGTHGDPMMGQVCRACNCHEKGSLTVACRPGDGQCSCRAGYEGVRCERCSLGRGNVDDGCPPCKCDPIGTLPHTPLPCDPITGQCACKPGVGGTLDCSTCSPGYYNLGPNGCQKCDCSDRAVDLICDAETGRCKCGENVLGDRCERCKSGHYWNVTGPNCLPCDCGIGTKLSDTLEPVADCNMQSGQCKCAPHVTGRRCTECEPGFYGVSAEGCLPCPSCPNGQVCDQVTGKCICPPNTRGDRCEACSTGSWDYNPVLGCKECNCSEVGAVLGLAATCDLVTGQCVCQKGYAGRACDQCTVGYYGYPDCKQCECDARGVLPPNTTAAVATAVCKPTDGSCFCKPNVQGTRCDECKPGTFGLSIDYELGCYSCFCFSSTSPPKCSPLTGYRSVPGKEKGVEIISTDTESSPGGALIQLEIGLGGEAITDLAIGMSQFNWRFSTHRPTYMEIPELKGSLTRRYGSVVIAVATECLPTGDCKLKSPDQNYPSELIALNDFGSADLAGRLIVRRDYRIDARMTALNDQIHLEYQPAEDAQGLLTDGYRQIWLRESDWVLIRVAGVDTRVRPTRNELMLALLNVTSFSVRLFMPEANPKLVSVKYRVYEALSETVTLSGTQIKSIEKCDCPNTSSGDHCEIASSGFYFPPLMPKPGPSILPPDTEAPPLIAENIIWTGGVEKCRCHGMSSNCDALTGVCEDCTGNTVGPDCGECAVGYMGDPKKGQPCIKCQCPTEQTDYAITCYPTSVRPYVSHQCVCKPGYTGLRCENCAPGYFGDPTSLIACQPCDCDMAGSRNVNCDQHTGQCNCWPGISGRRCDQCEPDHVVDAGRCQDCRGECTGELLVKADEVKTQIDNLNMTSLAYRGLTRLGQQAEVLRQRFSKEQEQQEDDLIQHTHQVVKQLAEVEEVADRIINTRNAIDENRCETQRQTTALLQSVSQIEGRVKDLLQRVKELPMSTPAPEQLQQWQEEARRVRTDLEAINLNTTEEWVRKMQDRVEKIITEGENLIKSVQPGRSAVDLERLEVYQEQQRRLLDLQNVQLYAIGNSTQRAGIEMQAAKSKSDALQKAVTEAIDFIVIQTFETNANKIRLELDNLTVISQEDITKRLDEARTALKNLTAIGLSDLDGVRIPPNLESSVVIPVEREAQAIISTLRFSPRVNRTVEALDAYQSVIEAIDHVENTTKQSEDALSGIVKGDDQVWQEMVGRVNQQGQDVGNALVAQEALLATHNKTLNEALKQLARAATDLDQVQRTADNALSDSQDAYNKAESIRQVLRDTQPQATNVSEMATMQRQKMDDLEDRLQGMENRYAQLQGTAQSTVDQANNTQTNLVKLVSETEASIKQMDAKLLRLRRLTDEARSLLDVSYGSLSKNPVPLLLGRDCVYTLVPYAASKSRVFDIEFWFRLHEDQPSMGGVLMVGRRAFAGRTQMFAFTLESSGSKLRFSWNVAKGVLELDALETGVWYQVRVTSIGGETRMLLTDRPNEEHPRPVMREVTSKAGSDHPESALILDRQMEIRIGGAVQRGSSWQNPEAWGDNGAESFWARLSSMEPAYFCTFNFRVGGITMSLADLASATPSCRQPSSLECQLYNYRALARDGYIWQVQSDFGGVTTRTRPPQTTPPNYLLQRLFYYDFAGTGGYARVQQFKDLKFCEDRVQFQVTPLAAALNGPMMVFTFFNFDKDIGVTVELHNGVPKAFKWTGNQLYRSVHQLDRRGMGENLRQRVLRAAAYSPRWRRSNAASGTEEKRGVSITQSDLTVRLWRVDELLATDCNDEVVMFVGAIPPGYHALRRRMYELGLSLTPFAGRVGITNEKPSQDGGLFLEEFVNTPVSRLGDTQYADLQQRGESLTLPSVEPSAQYCLRFVPDKRRNKLDVDEINLDTSKLGSLWEPGITMTLRFNPLLTSATDVSLLRLQMRSAEWLHISLMSDFRLGLVIPGASTKLITTESLTTRPVNDAAFALRDLELFEAQVLNASMPAWSDSMTERRPEADLLMSSTIGEIEVVITLHFGHEDSRHLDVLYDQRVIQSWTIPSQANVGPIAQALVGPVNRFQYPLAINYLVIGSHLVDFAKDLLPAEIKPGVQIGVCGGQLYPRFLKRVGPVGPVWVEQGLDLPTPPGGRRVLSTMNGVPISDVSMMRPTSSIPRIRRKEDCTPNPESTAWFDQTANSYWELSDLRSRIAERDVPFEFTIGFRAQLSHGGRSAPQVSPKALPNVQYNMLAAFNFGPEKGNIYLLLSETQIFVTDTNRVLWSSPQMTIADTNWHRLTLKLPHTEVRTDGNTASMPNGVYMEFDGRPLWLPRLATQGIPIVALIGGLPSAMELTLEPDENIVRMAFAEHGEPLTDFGHSANLISLPRNKNTWQYVKLQMIFLGEQLVLTLRSQVAQSLPLLLFQKVHNLHSIHFAQDNVVTPETMAEALHSSPAQAFTGCLRDIRLMTTTHTESIRFPRVTGLLEGVCHTSAVW